MLTKNCFLEEIRKQYVLTARAKGRPSSACSTATCSAMRCCWSSPDFRRRFIGILFTGALLIEVMFSLDGLGLLGFEAAIKRDYPIMFGTLYMFTLLGLLLKMVSDLTYTLIDPRIDFAARRA